MSNVNQDQAAPAAIEQRCGKRAWATPKIIVSDLETTEKQNLATEFNSGLGYGPS